MAQKVVQVLLLVGIRSFCAAAAPDNGVERTKLFGNINAYAYFFAELLVGTPPQSASVIVDTGSALCGFPCAGCSHCGNHLDPPFDMEASNTSRTLPCGPDCNRCDAARCGYLQSYSEGSSISGIWFRDLVMLNGDRHSVAHVMYAVIQKLARSAEVSSKREVFPLGAMDFQRRRNFHVVLFGLASLVCLPLGFVGPVSRSPTGTPGRKLRRISASAITLSRIPTGEGLMQKIDKETLQRLEEADLEVGMPDMSDLEEMTALMVDSFDRMLAKKRWDESNPFAEYANAFIDADETDKIAKGMQMRLDVSLQYQNLRRPVKQDESMALVARAKQGPLVAYVELCVLANDGRRPEDDDESLPEGVTKQPYLSNLCVAPPFRRSGIGKALLRVAEDVVRYIWKDSKMYLHIDEYKPARLLYESVGYDAVSDTDAEGVTHMMKELPPIEEEVDDDEGEDYFVSEEDLANMKAIEGGSERLALGAGKDA
eukprot:s1603_g19.t1